MNKIRIVVMFFVGIFLLNACAHRPETVPVKEKSKTSSSFVAGVVLYDQALNQGGTLVLTPFKAGAKAEANDELDHISMMVLKGIQDSLIEQNSNLHIIDSNQGTPKLGLGGFVKEFSKTKGLMQADHNVLAIEGELWLTSTGERVLSFTVKKIFDPKKEKSADVAYAFGKGIGEFMTKKAKSCVDSCT